jgi:hypothetical protein
MVTTNKDNAGDFDILVRTGRFPSQGEKIVLQKGSTKISIPFTGLPALMCALTAVALGVTDCGDCPGADEGWGADGF